MGAHLLNALPDLADDAATGVHGLPHRLGPRTLRWLAPLVLTAASAVTVFGPVTATAPWVWGGFVACVVLAGVAVGGRGRLPFLAAIGIAAVDVASLVLRDLSPGPSRPGGQSGGPSRQPDGSAGSARSSRPFRVPLGPVCPTRGRKT